MNPKLEAMMGLLIDSKHPALAQFPSETYCNWEWIDAIRLPQAASIADDGKGGARPRFIRAINIEKAPAQLKPIVQAIDDWNRNYKLAVVFECRVGNGRLMVCAPDIQTALDTRLVARQLRHSLLAYMATDRFQPAVTLSLAQANGLWPGSSSGPLSSPVPQSLPGDIIENPKLLPPR
jgi:beta-galactosidase